LFADDTRLVFHNSNLSKLEVEINNERKEYQWFNTNKLTIKVNKTAAMIIQATIKRKN